MTDEQEPRGKAVFSRQAFDVLANAEPELGEKLGATIRNIMEDPSTKTPTRRKATNRIREEDRGGLEQLVGSRVFADYNIIEPVPPFHEYPLILSS